MLWRIREVTAEMDSEGELYMRMDVFDGIKHTIRKAEGLIEVMLLTLAYYLIWKYAYRTTVRYMNPDNYKQAMLRVSI